MIRLGFHLGIDPSIFPRFLHPKNHVGKYWHGNFKNWKHKGWEIQIDRWEPSTLIDLDIDLRFRGMDHAGFRFMFNVLGHGIEASISDERHWNYEKNTWEVYDARVD